MLLGAGHDLIWGQNNLGSIRRWTLPAIFGVLAVSLTWAALAWACHPAASISLSPSSGSAGTSVTVSGNTFRAGAPVQITWNGATGQPLATATASPSGSFQTTITIPNAPADVYTIVAAAPGAPEGGTVASFTIPGPSPSRPDGSTSPAQPRQAGGSADSPGGPHATSGTVSGGDGVDGRSAGERAVAGGGERVLSRTSEPGAVVLPSGTSVFADSVTSSATPRADGQGSPNPSAGSRSAVSEASAASDLWSGFSSRADDGFLGTASGAAQASSSLPTLSLTLLGLGVLSAVAGVGVAGRRVRARRRALSA
jgi:hypothetical protein